MRIFFQSLWFAIVMQFRKTSGLRYFKHLDGKYLYLLISDKYIGEGEEMKFLKMFDRAYTISKFKFNFEASFYETEIVEVMDDEIFDENYPDESSLLKKRNDEYREKLKAIK